MASEDLNDTQLQAMLDRRTGAWSEERLHGLVAEIRRRRALDLTAEEVEALRLAARKLKRHRPDLRMDSDMTEQGQWTAMLAVLDRLIATHEEPSP